MIQGSIVALITPMHNDNSLDWDSLHKLVEWHLEKGSDAIVAVGTTGESATLSVTEHLDVIARVVDQVNGRIPVIAGTGANATDEAIELTEAAKTRGADACLLVTPYYNRPTQEGLYLHHKAVADAVAIPQILYNVPARTGVDMNTDTVLRLAALDNIVAVKEATGDIQRARDIIERAPADFLVYSGDDVTAVELMLAGGKGNISVTANVAPAELSQLCKLAIAGDADKARALNQQLMSLHQSLFLESNPIPVKWAVEQLGFCDGGIRLPMTYFSEKHHASLRAAMHGMGLL